MSLFNRVYEYLLPRARAFFFWASASQLREFFDGLTGLPTDARAFIDSIWLKVWPDDTDELDLWERQFNLPATGLNEASRRTRLDAAWKRSGGQGIDYIQSVIQDASFTDVFVHEFQFDDPSIILSDAVPNLFACDDTVMACGDSDAVCGNFASITGYVLVNKIRTAETFFLGAGDTRMACGDSIALCGNISSVTRGVVEYTIPADPDTWHYFLYFGAETFPEIAVVDVNRREEFEDLILSISPGQQWLGVLVGYT